MITLVALIVTTFLMPQPASAVTMPVAASWSSGAPAGLSLAASGPIRKPPPAAVTIAPVPRLPPAGSGLVAAIGFAALSLAMVVRTRQRKGTWPMGFPIRIDWLYLANGTAQALAQTERTFVLGEVSRRSRA